VPVLMLLAGFLESVPAIHPDSAFSAKWPWPAQCSRDLIKD